MAYVALYRKFRPQKFDELVGQEPIVRTLKNQLDAGRIAHAYLFAGPRGTGKTSTAKLFARAINCAHPVSGDPCGECDACCATLADDNMDIIEIDAASNNGVDNIRDIRDKVVFAPAYGKYKVYIIDEVHMLSPGAFNALLKTLEEPPKHVVFILATTEIHKLPATILSRCQRFDFKLISADVIADHLKDVLSSVGASFTDEAVDLIAKSASGGMRDALSLADVCLSYCGSEVNLEDAMNVLGISDRSFLFRFADMLLASDAAGALDLCRELENEGKDIGVFALELMGHFRDLMLSLYAPQSEELHNLTKENQEKLAAQAKNASGQRILRAIEILSKLESEIKLHARPEIQLETAVVRICLPETEADLSALGDRVDRLEKAVSSGSITVTAAPAAQTAPPTKAADTPPWETAPARPAAPERPAVPTREPAREMPQRSAPAAAAPAKPVSGGVWQQLMAKVKAGDLPLFMMIRNFDGVLNGDHFIIYIPEAAKSKEPLIARSGDELKRFLKEITGKDLGITAQIGVRPAGSVDDQGQKSENTDSGAESMLAAAMDLFS